MTPTGRHRIRNGLLGLTALFLVIQLLPFGPNVTNPPVIAEPAWDSPQTRALAERACFDCHSNETRWPLYARVAPGSWLVAHDVEEGREYLNFSEWQRPQKEAHEAGKVVREREMPLLQYRLFHSEARLTPVEREQLARGLDATIPRGSDEARSDRNGGVPPERLR